MSISPNDMELTPVIVSFKPAGATAYVDLGATLGNVKVGVQTEKAEIKADQTGSTPLDKRVSGHKFTITTEIAQTKDFQIGKYIFPNAVLHGGAPFNGTSPSASLEWVNAVGNSDISVAGSLKLHPQYLAASDVSYDLTFPKAVPTEASEISYGPADQSRWKIEWTVYPDVSATTGTDYPFFTYGDPSI